MPIVAIHPTPYPDVNVVLHLLLTEARAVLGAQFVGLYLYGSLATGDFNPLSSDIDFVVVTAAPLPQELVTALGVMHGRLTASGHKWAAKLEGAYMPQHTLRRCDPEAAPCPQINEGRFFVGGFGRDWVIQRHILREQGVVVAGPHPRPWIDPVSPPALRQAVLAVLQEWWQPMLADPAWLQRRDYQAFATLTQCRALYTLQHGAIVSKPTAARWAQTTLEPRWADLIARALAWPRAPQPDELAETLAFIQYAIMRSQTGNEFPG